MVRITRRRFLKWLGMGAGVSGVAGFGYVRGIEPDWLALRKYNALLDKNSEPVRILHFTDTHIQNENDIKRLSKAIEMGLAEKPHVACLTGDLISHKIFDAAKFTNIFKKLADAVPTYACHGNHDGGAWLASPPHLYSTPKQVETCLVNAGVTVLENRWTQIEASGRKLVITGLGDLWSNRCRPADAFEKIPTNMPVIALAKRKCRNSS